MTAQATVFRSQVYGYEVSLPPGWTSVAAAHMPVADEAPSPGTGSSDILGRGASTYVSRMTPPGVIVGAQPIADDIDTEEWATMAAGGAHFTKGCPEPDARDSTTVDGKPAVVLTFERCPASKDLVHLWVALVHRGLGYEIVWFDKPGSLEDQRSQLDDFLAGFSFKETRP